MSGKTITRFDLYDAVYRKVRLSRRESTDLSELVLKEITGCIARGESVKLASFGTFTVRAKGHRLGKNSKTGVEVSIKPRRVVGQAHTGVFAVAFDVLIIDFGCTGR